MNQKSILVILTIFYALPLFPQLDVRMKRLNQDLYPEALEYLEKLNAVIDTTKPSEYLALMYTGIGELYTCVDSRRKIREGMDLMYSSIDTVYLLDEETIKQNLPNCYLYLGYGYIRLGRLDSTEYCHEKGLEYAYKFIDNWAIDQFENPFSAHQYRFDIKYTLVSLHGTLYKIESKL